VCIGFPDTHPYAANLGDLLYKLDDPQMKVIEADLHEPRRLKDELVTVAVV
jgi:hypothetical protein